MEDKVDRVSKVDADKKAGVPDVEAMNTDLTGKKQMTPTQRAEAAIALRTAGASYANIAETLDFSSSRAAQSAVERLLAQTVTESDMTMMRNLANRRLESLLVSVTKKVRDPKNPDHMKAVAMSLAVQDRLIKLNGLDAPTVHKHEVSASMTELRGIVDELSERQMQQYPAEADVIDAEVVPELGQADVG